MLVFRTRNRAPVLNAIAPELMNELHQQEWVGLGVSCMLAGADPDTRVEGLVSSLKGYEIPIGESPSVRSPTLLQLVESARHICVAPMVLGTYRAELRLASGDYIGAILTTVAGSGMSLVLVGTVAVGGLLVDYLERRRGPRMRGGRGSERKV